MTIDGPITPLQWQRSVALAEFRNQHWARWATGRTLWSIRRMKQAEGYRRVDVPKTWADARHQFKNRPREDFEDLNDGEDPTCAWTACERDSSRIYQYDVRDDGSVHLMDADENKVAIITTDSVVRMIRDPSLELFMDINEYVDAIWGSQP